jgi:uncharacterized protein YjcR
MAEPFKTVTQIAEQYGDSPRTVQKWCQENDVPYIGEGRGKRYLIYPKYEAQFTKRNRLTGKPGQKAAQKSKKDR